MALDDDIPRSVVENFCALTGIDEQQARFFLEASNGDFDAALQMFQGAHSGSNLFPLRRTALFSILECLTLPYRRPRADSASHRP